MELTDKEKEVLRYLCKGYTYREIAETMFISEATARWHVHNMLGKLNLKDKMQLVVYAFQKCIYEEKEKTNK